MPTSINAMLDALQGGSDSDVAPMSPLVDMPTKEELKKAEMRKAEKSLKLASSTSEDELSEAEKQRKQEKAKAMQTRRVTFSDVNQTKVIEEVKKEETVMIDTTQPDGIAKKSTH